MKIAQIGEYNFGFNLINRAVLDEIGEKHLDQLSFEDEVCHRCVCLVPPGFEWSECLGGLPTQLCAAILDESGYGTIEGWSNLLNNSIEWARGVEPRMMGLIMFIFGGLRLDEVKALPTEELYQYNALAMAVSNDLLGMRPLLYLDEELRNQEIEKRQQEQRKMQGQGPSIDPSLLEGVFGKSRFSRSRPNYPVNWTPQGGATFVAK